MVKLTLKIEGMACGMCESHVNDTVRREFKVKKVSSSYGKGETVIITESDIEDDKLHKALDPTGYKLLSVSREPYEKKGLFSFGK